MLLPQASKLLANWTYVMVKHGQHFVLPYTQARMQSLHKDAPFLPPQARPWILRVFESLANPARFPAGSYFPMGWWHSQKQPAPSQPPEDLALWGPFYQEEIVIKAQGWYLGKKPIARRMAQYFLQQLRFDAEIGRYHIQQCVAGITEARYVHHQLPPFRVMRLENQGGTCMAVFNHGHQECFLLRKLSLGPNEQLYLRFGPQNLPALVHENLRWQLLSTTEESPHGWQIHLNDQHVVLPTRMPWQGLDPPY